MSRVDIDPVEAERRQYTPSGRVNWFALAPIMLAGIVVSLVMAVVLLLAERHLYYFFVTPLILGLPVFGMVWMIVRRSKCRNRGLAGFVGLVLAFCYYAGYWELSYLSNIVVRGPRMVAFVRQFSGLPGLPGYVVFRCKTSRPVDAVRGAVNARPPTKVDLVFNLLFFAGETLMVTCIAIGIGRTTSSRVFSERLRRWAARLECRLPLSTAPLLFDAVDRRDWAAVGALPRMSSLGNANTNSVQFRVEYHPGDPDEPAYVSVLSLLPDLKAHQVRQREIAREDLLGLAAEFPDLKLAQAPVTPDDSRPASSSALQSSLDQLGLGDFQTTTFPEPSAPAAPDRSIGGGDFRDRAVAASLAILAARPSPSLRTTDFSLCVPSAVDGRREVKVMSWRKLLIQIILFAGWVGCLLVGLVGTTMKDAQGKETPLGQTLMIAGMIGFFVLVLLSLFTLLGDNRLMKPLLAGRLGRRPGSLLELGSGLESAVFRVEDARTYHKQKVAGEDLGIALFDRDNRRVLLEGLSHRYVIRGEDVTCFWPLQAGEVISVRIDYRVGDILVPLVLATRNPYFHLFWGVFSAREIKRVISRFVETLRCDVRVSPTTEQPVE